MRRGSTRGRYRSIPYPSRYPSPNSRAAKGALMSIASGSSASFSQTLQFITTIKLQELEKQRLAYLSHAKILEEANAVENDPILKVEILLKGVRSWAGSGSVSSNSILGGKLNLSNLDLWLPQAKKDPGFSLEIAQGWASTLETHVRHSLMRFDCAKLFGNLFNEWLASGDSSTAPIAVESSGSDEMSSSSSEFVDVGRKEKYEQLDRLASIIFEEKAIDTEKLTSYMEDLFSSKEGAEELKALRNTMYHFGVRLRREKLSVTDVHNSIRGLLASGLMDEGKRATLAEFLDNTTVIDEVVSVLNMRMASLDTWSWPTEGIVVEMRRHLNGKYRAFTDPEIIDALLLQHIGVAWQVHLKAAFRSLFGTKAWKTSSPARSSAEVQRLNDQLDTRSSFGSGIEAWRRRTQKGHFFLSQLSTTAQQPTAYDDLLDAPAPQNGVMSPALVKQKLLQIMATESQLNKTIHGSHTVVRSDLEWFGPSLPHSSILTLLKFFGVSDQWVSFFETFLRAPLRFKNDLSAGNEVRIRKRGTPISYALSVVCGEIILFGMDFAVNQKADGLFLHRMHDDLWLWDAKATKCATGWKEMNVYAELVGLTFNKAKTGSAVFGSTDVTGLPTGDIRWGFLVFDQGQGRFVIDQKEVDTHIIELRRQLAATKSVFGWVNAYNKYMAFFARNFGGRPAVCFGQKHIEDVIDTLARIQRDLFPDIQGGAVAHLRDVIKKRFGVSDLPQGYFYLPIGSGGLELLNPMIEMFAIQKFEHQSTNEQNLDSFSQAILDEPGEYAAAREYWETTVWERIRGEGAFMSFEEFCSLRETWLSSWTTKYTDMLHVPSPQVPTLTPSVETFLGTNKPSDGHEKWTSTEAPAPALAEAPWNNQKNGAHNKWSSMDWYAKWVVSLYGEEVVARFGGLEVVDPTLIPVGMVQLFRTSRMKLDE